MSMRRRLTFARRARVLIEEVSAEVEAHAGLCQAVRHSGCQVGSLASRLRANWRLAARGAGALQR